MGEKKSCTFFEYSYLTFFDVDKTLVMKQSMVITSVSSNIKLPNKTLEKIINHRLRKEKTYLPVTGIDKTYFGRDFETVVTCNSQIVLKGDVLINFYNDQHRGVERIEIPMSSSFLVTCIKGKEGKYRVGISSSLS